MRNRSRQNNDGDGAVNTEQMNALVTGPGPPPAAPAATAPVIPLATAESTEVWPAVVQPPQPMPGPGPGPDQQAPPSYSLLFPDAPAPKI